MRSARLSFVAFGVVCGLVLSSFGDVVYVKPDGKGDGSSWSAAANLESAAGSAADGTEIRLAKGLYTLTATIHPTVNLTFSGGYAGVSEDEESDVDVNRTIISGDVNGDDSWVQFNIWNLAHNKTGQVSDQIGNIVQDGDLFIPEATGDDAEYMVFVPNTGKTSDNVALFVAHKGISVTLKGLYLTGAGATGNVKTDGKTKLNNGYVACSDEGALYFDTVRVIGNNASSEGTVYLYYDYKGATAVKNTIFKYNRVNRGALSSRASNALVEDTTFFGTYHAGTGAGSVYVWAGSGLTLSGCLFERVYSGSTNYSPTAGVGAEASGGITTIEGCAFRNLWIYNRYYGTFSNPLILASCVNFSYSSAKNNQVIVRGCLFEGNHAVTICSSASSTMLTLPGVVAVNRTGDTVENCTFLDNTVEPIVSMAGTTIISAPVYFATMNATSMAHIYLNLVNCTFAGNAFDDTQITGADTTLKVGRALAVNSLSVGGPVGVVVAHNTFAGAQAYPDIYCAGVDDGEKTYALNNIFVNDGSVAVHVPAVCEVPDALVVKKSLLGEGMAALPASIEAADNASDPLPLGELEEVGECVNPIRRAAAWTPTVRQAIGLVRFVNGGLPYFAYANGGDPTHICDCAVAIKDWVPLTDATGAARPDGMSTLGAAQGLVAAAETGYTVTTRVLPEGAGTVAGDLVQVVQPGGKTSALTATSSDPARYRFAGWEDGDGTSLGEEATLEPFAPKTSMLVHARFRAGAVKWTFDLGRTGTFGDGTSVKTLEVYPGDAAPEIPAYTIDPERWLVYGWDQAVPATVGVDDMTFTMLADEKVHRIVRFDSHATGSGDGESWENAMTDLRTAIAKAGLWTGEVWIKKGVHKFGVAASVRLQLKNGVAIRGGFDGGTYAGVDEERAARDPEANVTVLSADFADDDKWQNDKSQDVGEGGAALPLIAADGSLNHPAPRTGELYWKPVRGNGNAETMFDNSNQVLDETAVLDGVVLTGCSGTTMYNDVDACPLVTNCVFFGTGTTHVRNSTRFVGTTWEGYYGSYAFYNENSRNNGPTTVFDGCTFVRCATTARGALAIQNHQTLVRGCRFLDNYGEHYHWAGAAIGGENGRLDIYDTLFARNYGCKSAVCIVSAAYGGVVSNCVFEANVLENTVQSDNAGAAAIILPNYGGRNGIQAMDCTFRSNRVSRSSTAVTKNSHAAVLDFRDVDANGNGTSLALNCSFIDNDVSSDVDSTDYPPCAGTVVCEAKGGGAIVNCTFAGNVAADGDIHLAGRTGTTPVKVINSIFWSKAADYRWATKSGNDTAELWLLNSTAKGYTGEEAFVATAERSTADDPLLSHVIDDGKGWHSAYQLSGWSKVKKSGRDIFVDAKGVFCYVSDATGDAPVYAMCVKNKEHKPTEPLALVGDLFGEARRAGKFAEGALQKYGPSGLMIRVR